MKYIEWDVSKNEKLKEERGIGFEEVAVAMIEGKVLATIPHPNKKRYPNQRIYIIELRDYIYVVPFMEDEKKIFLKTIFPSRKYTKDFIEKGGKP